MGSKSAPKAASPKKEGPKKKPTKGPDKAIVETEVKLAASPDIEELEEEGEEAEARKVQSGNAAALAAATSGPIELSAYL
jgi:hypothetical protein